MSFSLVTAGGILTCIDASSDLKLSKSTIGRGDGFSVSVTVKNNGAMEALEVVQLYLTDIQSSVVTPNQFLAGFEKVSIP